jgi:hypothetical protein
MATKDDLLDDVEEILFTIAATSNKQNINHQTGQISCLQSTSDIASGCF